VTVVQIVGGRSYHREYGGSIHMAKDAVQDRLIIWKFLMDLVKRCGDLTVDEDWE
jgi:hypothetical protein